MDIYKKRSIERSSRKALNIPCVMHRSSEFAEWIYDYYLFETEEACKKTTYKIDKGDTWEEAAQKFIELNGA